MRFREFFLQNEGVSEGGFKMNVAKIPLKKARSYAEEQFKKAGKKLDEVLPDFDKNYMALQKATKKALDIPRVEMPVIEPANMEKFLKDLKTGRVDIFKPYVKGKEWFPKDLKGGKEGEDWLQLGVQDGDKKDDVVAAKKKSIVAKKLLPTQSQIWLEKLIGNTIKFGPPTQGSPVTKATIIVSKEGYILDGHHRYGQAMLGEPTLKMDAIFVPLDIKTLLKMGRSYGNAVGNMQKA